MFLRYAICTFGCIATYATAGLTRRDARASLQKRSTGQGWSLQASSCPSNTNSCGNGGCCPSSTFCRPAANGEVSACCLSNSECRGAVEGAPTCADTAWSLWKGSYNNGFCCDVSLIGAFIAGSSTAGTCVSSVPAGQTSAVLVTRGTPTGSSPTSTSTVITTTKPSTTLTTTSKTMSSQTSTPTSTPTGTAGKPIFMHYLIGTLYDQHCLQDIQDAQNLGVTAFALNIDNIDADWAINAVNSLFNHADELGFKLFFSLDLVGNGGHNPDYFQQKVKPYLSRSSYFIYQSKPLVSTFGGERVTSDQWNSFRQYMGNPITIVPGFYQATPSTTFFNNYPFIDGVFNWNSWPDATQATTVSSADDSKYQQAAKSASKLFMMGMSPLQFKHLNPDNYYRRGEQNLENRIGQVLTLQPDMLELQTWNDAGESHYMGNSWNEPINGSAIPYYSDGFDHTGYWQILKSFIQAWKRGDTTTSGMVPTNGKAAQGTFWHHPLLINADCSGDPLPNPKPSTVPTVAQDIVIGIVLVAQGQSGLTAVASSGSKQLGTATLKPGFNSFSFSGLTTGTVTVKVVNGNTNIVSGSGPVPVSNTAIKSPQHPEGPVQCNYNFQVVGLK